jgi:hypothetical protein
MNRALDMLRIRLVAVANVLIAVAALALSGCVTQLTVHCETDPVTGVRVCVQTSQSRV